MTALFATEDHAVVEFIARGTHTGVLHSAAGAIPPTGRQAEVHFCDVYRLKNRKITRHASYYDALGMMQQLGVIPVA